LEAVDLIQNPADGIFGERYTRAIEEEAMAKADYWATAPFCRDQLVLIPETLDKVVPADHPVRLFDEILRMLDWRIWEAKYRSVRGQPPIHPRRMAGLILYGLTCGLRSSRRLEDACANQLDLMWLMDGFQPDHSTICEFRTANQDELKQLFRQICQLAKTMGMIRLNQVAIDGTAIRANNGRYETSTREMLEKELDELERKIARMLEEAAQADAAEQQSLGDAPNRLPPELQNAEQRKEKLKESLKTLEELEEAKRKNGSKGKAQLPATDSDARVMLNKEGGYAPNYTPMAATDATLGLIVGAEVIQGNAEAERAVPLVDQVTENLGQSPESVVADGAFAQGSNIETFEQRGIGFYSPLPPSEPCKGDPAFRDDPQQPVPENQLDQLPMRKHGSQTQFDKSAFVYVPSEDAYYCPAGQRLPFVYKEREERAGQMVETRRYEADPAVCGACPLASRCLLNGGKQRTIRRDQYTQVRERHARKMQTEAARAQYKKRMGIAEPTFGFVKGFWRIRQFLLRGKAKVDAEWRWICAAYNINKMLKRMAALRADGTAPA
jgi:transposase